MWEWLPTAVAVAATDPPPRAPGEGRRAWAQAGWDPILVVDAGAGTAPRALSADLGLTGEAYVQVPPQLVAAGRTSLGAGLGAELAWAPGPFGAAVGVYGTLRSADDADGDWLAFGTTTIARPLARVGRWSVGPEASWAAAWATWHRPSEAVTHLYGDRPGSASAAPRTGFYAGTSHRARIGAAAAVAVGGRWTVSGAAGFAWTPHALHRLMDVPVTPMPFYAELGLGVRW